MSFDYFYVRKIASGLNDSRLAGDSVKEKNIIEALLVHCDRCVK